jgi:hypothetical protein
MDNVTQVKLTGRASRFLQIIEDLGHLDGEGVHEVMLALDSSPDVTGAVLADLDSVKQAAASVLFMRAGELGIDGILAEDWPLLFS